MKQRLLILLSLILIALIAFLAFYAYYSNKIFESPLPNKEIKETQENKIQEENSEKINQISEIKKEINGIKNETFKLEEPTEDCSNEESKEYEEKIKTGTALVAEGFVSEISPSSLKIKFQQNSISWTSTVTIDSKTTFSSVKNLKETPISFSDIKVGERLVVRTSGQNITDSNFVAASILKIE